MVEIEVGGWGEADKDKDKDNKDKRGGTKTKTRARRVETHILPLRMRLFMRHRVAIVAIPGQPVVSVFHPNLLSKTNERK
jgi:hypothetical protein